MISADALAQIKTRFTGYVSGFYTGAESYDSSIRLKETHSANVAAEIRGLAESIELPEEQCCLAEAMGTLHDIGRFEQFARYRVYNDSLSEDHAAMGLRALRETGMISDFDKQDQQLIGSVIEHHNRAALPANTDEQFLLFLKLLRDADKIDIWRVVTGHYLGESTNSVIDCGLPDNPEISDAVIQCIMHGETARVGSLKTLNDFKFLQIGWVFDINFPRTYRIIRERKYLDKIRTVLPDNDAVSQSLSVAMRHLDKQCLF
ncbi:MAG: HD domain-containing protein [Chitinispirillaceae bacterium]|jgi:hypothetical protein|nr:HD domain-containing protein [Chitinispirillaceae bacterium]